MIQSQRHIVPVVVADYIPARIKAPLVITVTHFIEYEVKDGEVIAGDQMFRAESRLGSVPVSVDRNTFNLSVVECVRHTFKRFLTLRQEQMRLAPNLQDEYRLLSDVFEYD